MQDKLLIVIVGPTAVGKTKLSLDIAERLGCPILNCDSRQIYRHMQIGTASPTPEMLARVKHYFVGELELDEYYSAARYEEEALKLITSLFETNDALILSGGSMMYVDAVCKGIDDIPTVDEKTRTELKQRLETEGLESLVEELRVLDPKHYEVVDRKNAKRVVHALEICHMTGQPYSGFLSRKTLREGESKRPFRILKIGLERPREELFERINTRVDQMVAEGLLHEAYTLLPYRHLNSLNTVGYKEMFNVIDGTWEIDMAVERSKKNTRVYAKKQMTWFKHDKEIFWFSPDDTEPVWNKIQENLKEVH